MSDGPAIIIPGRSEGKQSRWEVLVGDDGVHFRIMSTSGRTAAFVFSGDCADKIAGALHKASRQFQWNIIRQKGSVGGGL